MKKNYIEEYTKESIDYLKNTDIKKRKKLGQYFTPKSIRELLLSKLPKKIMPIFLTQLAEAESFYFHAKNILKIQFFTVLI